MLRVTVPVANTVRGVVRVADMAKEVATEMALVVSTVLNLRKRRIMVLCKVRVAHTRALITIRTRATIRTMTLIRVHTTRNKETRSQTASFTS
jgi:hypothetical protein